MAFILAEKPVEKESNRRTGSRSFKKETIVFIALTLGLTFLLNFVMWLNFDLIVESIELLALATRVQMSIPAFSAIILNLFIFKTKIFPRKARILFYYFLVLATLFTLVFAFWLVNPIDISSIQPDSIENLGQILIAGILELSTLILTLG